MTHYRGGLNINDPAFIQDPKLRSLKLQLIPAILAFCLGLVALIAGLSIGFSTPRLTAPAVTIGVIVFTVSTGWFLYVSVAMPARYRRYKEELIGGALGAVGSSASDAQAFLQQIHQARQAQQRQGSLVTCPTCGVPASPECMSPGRGCTVVTCPSCRSVYQL